MTAVDAKSRILLIDDDRDFTASIGSLLENEGYAVETADSGKRGLQRLVESPPDLIVLDIMMETSSEGYGVMQAIRFDEQYSEYQYIPVMMVSAVQTSPQELFWKSSAGEMIRPDCYLTKPLDIPKFLQSLKRLLKK